MGEVCTALIVHPKNIEVQITGCAALWTLTCNMPSNKAIAAKACALNRLCNTLAVHLPQSESQEDDLGHTPESRRLLARVACGALACVCGLPQSRRQVTQAQYNGIDCVLRVMKHFSQEGSVQEQACAAISGIATDDRANQVELLEKGALQTISTAMTLHAKDELLQEQACNALASLACLPACRPFFAEAGLATQIVAVMEMHSGVASVQVAGSAALRNLA